MKIQINLNQTHPMTMELTEDSNGVMRYLTNLCVIFHIEAQVQKSEISLGIV